MQTHSALVITIHPTYLTMTDSDNEVKEDVDDATCRMNKPDLLFIGEKRSYSGRRQARARQGKSSSATESTYKHSPLPDITLNKA